MLFFALVQNIFIHIFKKKADVQNMSLFKMHVELFQIIIKLFYFHDFVFINYHLTLSASLGNMPCRSLQQKNELRAI